MLGTQQEQVKRPPGPLVAIYWDIENCPVPRGKSALAIADCIRDEFLSGRAKEAEFLCVCDVSKESAQLIKQLNDAQVTVVHIDGQHKNAADEKLKHCMRKFCDTHKAPVTVVLISGDADFATDLSQMRHSHQYHIILVHNKQNIKQALSIAAHQVRSFDDVIANVPEKENGQAVPHNQDVQWVRITNLPTDVSLSNLRSKLGYLISNTRGKIIHFARNLAIAEYSQEDWAIRGAKRMNGQNMFGSKISACHVSSVQNRPPSMLMPFEYLPFSTSNQPFDNLAGSLMVPPTNVFDRLSPSPDNTTSRYQALNSSTSSSFLLSPTQHTAVSSCNMQDFGPTHGGNSNLQTPVFSRTPGSKKYRCALPRSITNTSNAYPRFNTPQRPTSSLFNSNAIHNSSSTWYPGIDASHLRSSAFVTPSDNSFSTPIQPSAARAFQPHRLLLPLQYRTTSTNPRQIVGGQKSLPHHSSDNILSDSISLSVTNLDYNITAKEWKNILYQTFQQYVQVLYVDVKTLSDNSSMALVYVSDVEDARYAISQCHRKKIGYKRLQVSLYCPQSPSNGQKIRAEVRSLLTEVAGNTLPLFKFIELYEKRYHKTITVSELYHMRDTIEIKDQSGKGRMICLQMCAPMSSNQLCYPSNYSYSSDLVEKPYCLQHCNQAEYTLLEESGMLPYVKIELNKFAPNVYKLIKLHDGDLPLLSFAHCYAAAFTKLIPASEGGVPLEHLITCVPNVSVKANSTGMKKVFWIDSRSTSPTSSIYSETSYTSSESTSSRPSLSHQLSQFSREVVDLLKRMPACQMSFSKFIPSYHHHFGRQCRVADFGFTKLQELFEAIPHVLQVLGTGNQKVLYLTHRIHVRRFTADLIKVLKNQVDKQCLVSEFPELYSEVIGTDMVLSNFGVCYIEDMLMEISDSQIVVSGSGKDMVISIPKKDQTPQEIEKTRQFSYEVIDLLKNCPQCTMPFNKFIPSYHHHFGKQCKVAEFGFSKLVELFEAIPDIVSVTEIGEERYISLTQPELFKVLSEQILGLLKLSGESKCIAVRDLGPVFQRQYGHNIYIEEFGVDSVEDLIVKISHIAHIEKRSNTSYVALNKRSDVELLAKRSMELMMEKCNGEMRLARFMERYQTLYDDHPDLVKLKHELYPAILIKEDKESGVICLHPLLSLARRIKLVLTYNQGRLTLLTFEVAYKQSFGISLDTKICGFPGVSVMLQMMDFMVSIRGRGNRQTILLRQDYLSRLAHQLAYKIGIYTEIVKYKDLDKNEPTKSSGSDSGILDGDNSYVRNESIQASSPDLFPLTPVEQGKPVMDTLSISPLDGSFLHSDTPFAPAADTVIYGGHQSNTGYFSGSSQPTPYGIRHTNHPNLTMSLRMRNSQKKLTSTPQMSSPRRARIAASFNQ